MFGAPRCLEEVDGWTTIGRHRHADAYVAVVIAGAYHESGDAGRFDAREGDVLVHAPFEAHRDEISSVGARILNLPCPGELKDFACWHIADPAALAALASRDPREALLMLGETAIPGASPLDDWQDLLAARLRTFEPFMLADWAELHGLSPESVSRGFARVFGVSPHRYRAEARARRAIVECANPAPPLAAVAAKLGFSDQAHMTRAVRALSGLTPGEWRRCAVDTMVQGSHYP